MTRYLCFVTLLAVVTLATSSLSGVPLPENALPKPVEISDRDVAPMVFFAVLEGLYTDGVSTDAVNLILAADPQTGQPRLEEHFVYACPLCLPAFDAFHLYKDRPRFHGRKDNADTFGAGLDAKMLKLLQSPKKPERLQAIQTLVASWVKRRLDTLALTPDQRKAWSGKLEESRQKGGAMLRLLQAGGRNAEWKGCAICDGVVGGCKLKN